MAPSPPQSPRNTTPISNVELYRASLTDGIIRAKLAVSGSVSAGAVPPSGDVLSLSFGTYPCRPTVRPASSFPSPSHIASQGCSQVVAASGNDGSDHVPSPALSGFTIGCARSGALLDKNW